MNQSIKEKGGWREERMLERHRAKLPRPNRIKGLWKELGEITKRQGGDWSQLYNDLIFPGPWTPKSSY